MQIKILKNRLSICLIALLLVMNSVFCASLDDDPMAYCGEPKSLREPLLDKEEESLPGPREGPFHSGCLLDQERCIVERKMTTMGDVLLGVRRNFLATPTLLCATKLMDIISGFATSVADSAEGIDETLFQIDGFLAYYFFPDKHRTIASIRYLAKQVEDRKKSLLFGEGFSDPDGLLITLLVYCRDGMSDVLRIVGYMPKRARDRVSLEIHLPGDF